MSLLHAYDAAYIFCDSGAETGLACMHVLSRRQVLLERIIKQLFI